MIEAEKIIAWMRSSGCVIGIGDGLGANYITSDQCIDKLLARKKVSFND